MPRIQRYKIMLVMDDSDVWRAHEYTYQLPTHTRGEEFQSSKEKFLRTEANRWSVTHCTIIIDSEITAVQYGSGRSSIIKVGVYSERV